MQHNPSGTEHAFGIRDHASASELQIKSTFRSRASPIASRLHDYYFYYYCQGISVREKNGGCFAVTLWGRRPPLHTTRWTGLPTRRDQRPRLRCWKPALSETAPGPKEIFCLSQVRRVHVASSFANTTGCQLLLSPGGGQPTWGSEKGLYDVLDG